MQAIRSRRVLTALALLCALVYFASAGAAISQTPAPTPAPAAATVTPAPLSGNVPLAIPAHDTSLSPTNSRPFFDLFSWESFVALNWPADPQHHGRPLNPSEPKQFTGAKNGTPVVWTSYKSAEDLYAMPSPPPWNGNGVTPSVCPNPKNAHVLVRVSKTDSLLHEVNQAFSYPLIDQNRNFAWYDERFNQTQYEYIQKNQLYLLQKLVAAEQQKGGLQLPASSAPSTYGSLMVKAAWREMVSGRDDTSRYYVTAVTIYDPTRAKGSQCYPAQVGLVGLHIVQKLGTFPEWIWSTFEQVDNVQRGPGAKPATPISFNNGTRNPPTGSQGYAYQPPPETMLSPKPQRVPVQVARLNPIPTTPAVNSTVDLNARYRQKLAGTVWANYQLVATQWPSNPGDFKVIKNNGIYPQDSGGAFPATAITNTAIETYFQSARNAAAVGNGGNSCMGCHFVAAESDYSWSLRNRAHR